MRLRTTLTIVMTGIAAVAVGVALTLVFLTSSLYQTGQRLAGAAERVRLLMELESYALQHVRDAGGVESTGALGLIEWIRVAHGEARQGEVKRLEDGIRALAAAAPGERRARFDAFVADLRAVVDHEDREARRELAEGASRQRAANVTAFATVVLLLGGVGAVLAWLWRSALEPLFAVVEAIQRFATGDTLARAVEAGPVEVRQIAVAFNDMAASLGRQREQQLAFIGGVAHDLRTPLNALQVAVTLIDKPGSDPQRVRDRVRRQIERLDSMVSDLLDRTRIETGRFELHRADHDLRTIVSHVVDVQRDTTPLRTFTLRLPAEPARTRVDPLRIEQVVNNLLGNAAKYSPDSSDIEITLTRVDSAAVLTVADHGIGMTPGDRARIFEPFRRGSNVGNIGGSGLGLSVTRKIVEAHGGTIAVASEPGAGSVFTVSLPAS
jgi:signal transduction histidine kinase